MKHFAWAWHCGTRVRPLHPRDGLGSAINPWEARPKGGKVKWTLGHGVCAMSHVCEIRVTTTSTKGWGKRPGTGVMPQPRLQRNKCERFALRPNNGQQLNDCSKRDIEVTKCHSGAHNWGKGRYKQFPGGDLLG